MRRIALAMTCVLLGCNGEAPTTSLALQAGDVLAAKREVPKNYGAQLSGREEVPPNSSRSRGSAQFQLSDDGESISYRLIVANLEDLNQAHIHVAPPGANGGVVVWLYPSAPPTQLIPGTTSGVLATGTFTADDLRGSLADGPLSALVAAMVAGNTYVNVHTVDLPGGEIRGQIKAGG